MTYMRSLGGFGQEDEGEAFDQTPGTLAATSEIVVPAGTMIDLSKIDVSGGTPRLVRRTFRLLEDVSAVVTTDVTVYPLEGEVYELRSGTYQVGLLEWASFVDPSTGEEVEREPKTQIDLRGGTTFLITESAPGSDLPVYVAPPEPPAAGDACVDDAGRSGHLVASSGPDGDLYCSFDTPNQEMWYQKPVVWVGGAVVLALGGLGLWLGLRKR